MHRKEKKYNLTLISQILQFDVYFMQENKYMFGPNLRLARYQVFAPTYWNEKKKILKRKTNIKFIFV